MKIERFITKKYQIEFPRRGLEKQVKLLQQELKSLIHQKHHKGDNQGSNGYDYSAVL